jgi:cobyrinic acid a,c-diamide synthase
VIAGAASGVGKTSLALGLARHFTRQGLRVQTFKVGPDFLDPTWLRLASGRTCYNLDAWMTSERYVRELFARTTADADLAIVEGVMGLFDGARPDALEGSTAQIAAALESPVVLVVNAHGMARSLAALVYGYSTFDPSVHVAGVIANQGGSERHRAWLSESLAARSLAPLMGMVPRGSLPTLPSRHLGLVTADHAGIDLALLDRLAQGCGEHVDTAALLGVATRVRGVETEADTSPSRSRSALTPCPSPVERARGETAGDLADIRVGFACDEAFHFYYPDNLEFLEHHGLTLVPFSPLSDSRLPGDLDALYFGGGYPEVHAERLAANGAMLADVRQFAESGGAIYAECGGLMYLGRSLTTQDDTRYPLAGVLPIETAMRASVRSLAYTEATLEVDSLWGRAGTVYRGHEFHYSEIASGDSGDGWQPAYAVRRRGSEPTLEGLARGRILAGYVHLHWASRPEFIAGLRAWLGKSS